MHGLNESSLKVDEGGRESFFSRIESKVALKKGPPHHSHRVCQNTAFRARLMRSGGLVGSGWPNAEAQVLRKWGRRVLRALTRPRGPASLMCAPLMSVDSLEHETLRKSVGVL